MSIIRATINFIFPIKKAQGAMCTGVVRPDGDSINDTKQTSELNQAINLATEDSNNLSRQADQSSSPLGFLPPPK